MKALLFLLTMGAVEAPLVVHGRAEAIAIADEAKTIPRSGRFEMVVKSAGRNGHAITFLNSNDDYRSPGDLTFALSPAVGTALRKKFGSPPEQYLIGKHVVVDGAVRRGEIVNTVNQSAHDFNRYSYSVEIKLQSQIVSID